MGSSLLSVLLSGFSFDRREYYECVHMYILCIHKHITEHVTYMSVHTY